MWKVTLQILPGVFVIKKVKNTVPQTYVKEELNGEEIVGTFYEKELEKTNQAKFRIEKIIKKKDDQLYVKWKGYGNSFNIDKKDILYKMSQYFPKLYERSGGNVKVEFDPLNYATNVGIKEATGVYIYLNLKN